MLYNKREYRRTLGLALLLLLAGCKSPEPTSSDTNAGGRSEIIVSAAASLQEAFREIGTAYTSRTNTKITFNFAASGQLQRQIESGAPADVFASAGQREMDALATKNLIATETRRNFARNTLVLVVPAGTSAGINSFAKLGDANVRRIAVGNPKTVPAGQYAERLLTNMNLWQTLQPKLILAEDVRQVIDYVARGEVDAGIVYVTDARSAQSKVTEAAQAPEEESEIIFYPVAIVRDSRHGEAARSFIEFLTRDEGQTILTKHGFGGAR